jgi:hypothetical protein
MEQEYIDVYNKMPKAVQRNISHYKEGYNNEQNVNQAHIWILQARAYTFALHDVGFITDEERKSLLRYVVSD